MKVIPFLLFILLLVIFLVDILPRQCSYQKINQVARGGSLTPLVNDGQIVVLLEGYYNCYPIRRNDIIEFSLSNRALAKIIKAIPKDIIALEKNSDQGWYLRTNGAIAKNSQGIPYLLSDSKAQLLNLYINDYQGIIPKDSYLVLGNQPQGTLDSTRFGLVPKVNILGKIIHASP